MVKSLKAALRAFCHSTSLKDGCLLAVNLGDVAGTTGTIYGQIAGAHYGVDAMPMSWRERIAYVDLIAGLAMDLCENRK